MRLQKATILYGLPRSPSLPFSATSPNIATYSSQELFQHSLQRVISDNLFSLEEVEAYDPRLLLTLPRMAILYGIHESSFPVMKDSGQNPMICKIFETPLEIFLPRLCRTIPHDTVKSIRSMTEIQLTALAKRLCVMDSASTDTSDVTSGDTEITRLFRVISTEADGGGVISNGGRHIKLMKKVLRSYLDAGGGFDPDGEDEITIARAFLAVAGIM